ncbi:type II toxin-antitoxin system VapC family toxin [Geobacter sp. SVR]|uniref:type II toxin-antitoxin system VapC family toxin n=1 Tax=Geobacter sp. SVR TaxID=2495594 RepID=UPI00143F04D8|nr:type II toxin-antitoxin system VapC family toxin [Geobacter sp. SVR]BCS55439.1 ribonuclease VapC [Geobacter sp. SVR]GCF83441.1 ribonuclease VapC [Geobacter sp. SVR]
MKYLLDTCLISELVKKEPNPSVVRWLDEQDEQKLFLSVLNVGELQKGISKLPNGAKKDELQAWVTLDLVERFTGRILDLDLATALCWGRQQGEAERNGEKLPVMDALIAATAAAHGLVVVTRNVSDMERCGARVWNPWE